MLAGERREGDLRHGGLADPRRAIPRPVRREEQSRSPHHAVHERRHALLRRRVDPLEVLDHEDDRAALGAVQPHLPERLEGSGLDGAGTQGGERLRALLHPEEVKQVGRRLLGRHPQRLEPLAHLRGDRRGRVQVRDPEVLPEDVEDGEVRDRAPVRLAAPLEIGDPEVEQGAPELEDQTRLPDAGLAEDAHRLAVSLQREREAALEELQLVAASGEGGRPAPGARGRRGGGPESVGGLPG